MIRHRAWLPAMVAVVALALAGCSMATAGELVVLAAVAVVEQPARTRAATSPATASRLRIRLRIILLPFLW